MKKQAAVAHFGGVRKLAQALGCKPQAVSQWGETIPQGRAYQIESMTGGQLKVNHADYASHANPNTARKAHL